MPWRAIQTKPLAERLALSGLKAYARDTLLPRWRHVIHARGRRIETIKPMFPGYVFADLVRGSARALERLPGVLKVLGDAPLEDGVIVRIRSGLDDDGILVTAPIAAGTIARIGSSLLSGQRATVERIDSSSRASVLIAAFGRAVTVNLPLAWLDGEQLLCPSAELAL